MASNIMVFPFNMVIVTTSGRRVWPDSSGRRRRSHDDTSLQAFGVFVSQWIQYIRESSADRTLSSQPLNRAAGGTPAKCAMDASRSRTPSGWQSPARGGARAVLSHD